MQNTWEQCGEYQNSRCLPLSLNVLLNYLKDTTFVSTQIETVDIIDSNEILHIIVGFFFDAIRENSKRNTLFRKHATFLDGLLLNVK